MTHAGRVDVSTLMDSPPAWATVPVMEYGTSIAQTELHER